MEKIKDKIDISVSEGITDISTRDAAATGTVETAITANITDSFALGAAATTVLTEDNSSAEMIVGSDIDSSPPACPSCCEGCRLKIREDKEYRDLIARLNRIEGQIRGIKGMVNNSAYCLDILTQVSAATSALNSFSKVLLANHVNSCVANDIRAGNDDKLKEFINFLPKMMR